MDGPEFPAGHQGNTALIVFPVAVLLAFPGAGGAV